MRFLFFVLFSPSLFAAPQFLHLQGHVKKGDPVAIYADLRAAFIEPLEHAKSAVLYSQVSQAWGDGFFVLNLILEPGDPDFVARYVQGLEGLEFYGETAHFQNVTRIAERAELEAGVYVDGRQDPFQQTAAIARDFSFTTLREWLDFSNAYGYALMEPDNAKVMDYLRSFIGDSHAFENFRDQVLSASNMIAIFPQVTLELEGGKRSGPAFETTPFLPYRFFRNCYSSRYEGGMCWRN